MDDLKTLRLDLVKITQETLSLVAKRADIISQIQKLKRNQGSACWDPKQEVIMFKSIIGLQQGFSAQDLLCFSLFIETQVSRFGDYPHWSESVHLVELDQDNRLYCQINPILVFLTDAEKYNGLKLKTEYHMTLKELFKNV